LREKYILRKSFSDLLPPGIGRAVKQPYRAPDSSSFLGSDGADAPLIELLSTDRIRAKGYFDHGKVRRLVEKCRTSRVLGFKDNMSFVGVLTTQILDELFVRRFSTDGEVQQGEIRTFHDARAKT
jgi:asparagine synthase (glutamine-hydrolysing)